MPEEQITGEPLQTEEKLKKVKCGMINGRLIRGDVAQNGCNCRFFSTTLALMTLHQRRFEVMLLGHSLDLFVKCISVP